MHSRFFSNIPNIYYAPADFAGTYGSDTIVGNATSDEMSGSGGNDILLGLEGDDTIDGGSGNDALLGGDGNDTLTGGSGSDLLDGGEGVDDTAVYSGLRSDYEIIKVGNDFAVRKLGTSSNEIDVLTNMEKIIFEGDTPNVTINLVNATLGNGIDFVEGAYLETDAGGIDVALIGDGSEGLPSPQQRDHILGSSGNDSISSGHSTDILFGGAGDDTLDGEDGIGFAYGGQGDDLIIGSQAKDLLHGGTGRDLISGGDGDDEIIGGLGADTLTGGNNKDTFSYYDVDESNLTSFDTITDFDTLRDTIRLQGLTVGTFSYIEDATFSASGNTEARFNDATETLEIDTDGNGSADMNIVLTNVSYDELSPDNFEIIDRSVNTPPVAVDDARSTTEDQLIGISYVYLLGNDSDADWDAKTITSFTQPDHGTLTDTGDELFIFTPEENWSGVATFTYTISDGNGGTDTATVKITVSSENDAPIVGTPVLANGMEDQVYTFSEADLLAAAFDVENDSLTIEHVRLTQGALGDNGDGTYTITMPADYNGTMGIIYDVSDGQLRSQGYVSVTFDPVNDAPRVSGPVMKSMDEDGNYMFVERVFLVNAIDVDGDEMSLHSITSVTGGTLYKDAQTGLWHPTPDQDSTSEMVIEYIIQDEHGAMTNHSMIIDLLPLNDAPVANNDVLVGSEDQPFIFTAAELLANDNDVDGDTLSILSFNQPEHGTIVENADGTYTFTPDENWHGETSFDYTISDGNGGSETATVSINVASVSDVPEAAGGLISVNAGDEAVWHLSGVADDGGAVTFVIEGTADADGWITLATGRVRITDATTGTYEFEAASDASGEDSFTYSVTDGLGNVTYGAMDIVSKLDTSVNGLVRLGAEFQVNTYTASDQRYPEVGSLTDGGYVIAWSSTGQDGSNDGVYGQRYDVNDQPVGAEFRINNYTSNAQNDPVITGLSDGGFIISWYSMKQDGNSWGAYAKKYDANGDVVLDDFRVSAITNHAQMTPRFEELSNGNLLAVWRSDEQGGDAYSGNYGQIFDASGNRIGGEFRLNTYTADRQLMPVATALEDGGFVASWMSYYQDGSYYGIYAQRFDASGNKVGSEVHVSEAIIGNQQVPDITTLEDGGYIIVWSDDQYYNTMAQRYDASGMEVGGNFQINTQTNFIYSAPAVKPLPNGGFIVIWQAEGYDGDAHGVFAQAFDADSNKIGGEFQVNSYTLGKQDYPEIEVLENGDILMAWQSDGQDGSGYGVYAQRVQLNVGDTQGDQGNDILIGNLGDNHIDGLAGDDLIKGEGGDDTLSGGAGDDDLYGGSGSDSLYGGDGYDRAFFKGNSSAYSIVEDQYGNKTVTHLESGDVDYVDATVEELIFGPEAAGGLISVNAGDEAVWHLSGVADDGGAVTFVIEGTADADGWITLATGRVRITDATTGTYEFEAASDASGEDSFTYSVTDGLGNVTYGAMDIVSKLDTSVNGLVRLGAEFQVNTYTASDQRYPEVGSLTDGGYVIAWSSTGQDGSNDGVYGQRYDVNDQPVGAEFRINNYTSNAQNDPVITGLSDGGFIISWYSMKQDGNSWGAYAKKYDANGDVVLDDFRVSAITNHAQMTPRFEELSNGNLLAVWRSDEQGGDAYSGNYGQIFDASGNRIGGEFRLNTYTADRQLMPVATALEDGGFVASWMSYYQDGSYYGIYAQRFDASGNKVGSEVHVSEAIIGNQQVPDITTLEDGGYIIVWSDDQYYNTMAQRYDASGMEVGGNFQINTQTNFIYSAPAVKPLPNGGFIVIWQAEGYDGDAHGVFAQAFDVDSNKIGGEFQVNSYTLGKQDYPEIEVLENGDILMAWQSDGQDGSGYGVYAQRVQLNVGDTQGDQGNDILIGNLGDNHIDGLAGDDLIKGEGGDDTLSGGSGNDELHGGAGDDLLDGGEGSDVFTFASEEDASSALSNLERVATLGTDTLQDFTTGEDTFSLHSDDFGFDLGALSEGDTYFEVDDLANLAGDTGPAIVVVGADTGAAGVEVWYTEDASVMDTTVDTGNSYQIADADGINLNEISVNDFIVK